LSVLDREARGGDRIHRVGRRSPIGACIGAIDGVDLVSIERGLEVIAPELAAATAWLLLGKGLYDVERAPLPSEATEPQRRAYFDAVRAELGDGALAIVLLGRGEPLDVATVLPRAEFADWAPALLARSSPTSAFLFSPSRDVAVLLQRRATDVVVRIAHAASARLVAAADKDRAATAARAADQIARLRRRVAALAGVEIGEAPADLPSPETIARATPWEESSPRRLRDRAEPGAWLAERLASLETGATCFVWQRGMLGTWLALRVPSNVAWLVELWSGAEELIVLSGDGARALVLLAEEYDDVACLVPVAALLDRAASLADLDARIAENDGLRLAAPTGPRQADPAVFLSPARGRGRGTLADPRETVALLAALVGDLDMAERLPEIVKSEGVVGTFGLSVGHLAPLAFRTVFTFDAGQWLVDLWQTGLDRLFVARPDDAAVLAFLRVDDAAEVFLGPRSSS
jgi:hypothetical protein